jgi:hypothetical protein
MKAFRVSRGRALTQLIGDVDRMEYKDGGPGLAAIIVRKDTGYPGGGYFYGEGLPPRLRRAAGRSTDPRLSDAEKEYIKAQQEKIWTHYRAGSRKGSR